VPVVRFIIDFTQRSLVFLLCKRQSLFFVRESAASKQCIRRRETYKICRPEYSPTGNVLPLIDNGREIKSTLDCAPSYTVKLSSAYDCRGKRNKSKTRTTPTAIRCCPSPRALHEHNFLVYVD